MEILKLQTKDIGEKFRKKPQLISEYNQLINRQNVSQNNLLSLVNAREKLQLELAQENISWKIIEPPLFDEDSFAPSLRLRFGSALILALFMSSIIGYIRDIQDSGFKSINEIKISFSKFEILGIIPFISIFKNISSNNGNFLELIKNNYKNNNFIQKSKDLYKESFRKIFASLKLNKKDSSCLCFLITSSKEGEGKSLSLSLLGITLSEMGYKTLIIDLDFRKPIIHKLFKLDNDLGFSNILSDEKINWESTIQGESLNPELKFISVGSNLKDPTKLLASERYKQIINNIKGSDKFDYILINSPPILGISDTYLISQCCDKVLFIVTLNYVPRMLFYESLKNIVSSTKSIPGILINIVDKKTQENETFKNKNYYYNYSNSSKPNNQLILNNKYLTYYIKKIKNFFYWLDL